MQLEYKAISTEDLATANKLLSKVTVDDNGCWRYRATEQDYRDYRELKHRYDMWLLEEKRKLRASALAKLGLTEAEWNALMDR